MSVTRTQASYVGPVVHGNVHSGWPVQVDSSSHGFKALLPRCTCQWWTGLKGDFWCCTGIKLTNMTSLLKKLLLSWFFWMHSYDLQLVCNSFWCKYVPNTCPSLANLPLNSGNGEGGTWLLADWGMFRARSLQHFHLPERGAKCEMRRGEWNFTSMAVSPELGDMFLHLDIIGLFGGFLTVWGQPG